MVAIYVVAALCVVGMILIASISMFSSGTGSTAIAEERMERRQAKLDQQETGDQQGAGGQQEAGGTATPTPLPSSSQRAFDDAA